MSYAHVVYLRIQLLVSLMKGKNWKRETGWLHPKESTYKAHIINNVDFAHKLTNLKSSKKKGKYKL